MTAPPTTEAVAVVRARAERLTAADARRGLDGVSRIVHQQSTPPMLGSMVPAPDEVAAVVGTNALYRHQADAIRAWRARSSVVLSTGTGSGKSLVGHVAIADAARRTPAGTALVLCPTKALANDQQRAMEALQIPGVVASTYDGDTPRDLRSEIRDAATVVFTNPDMLHYAVLPHHVRWIRFLARLEVIVVDELHTYRGVFGAHVAHILRRLVRLSRHYGGSPRFIAASATVADPAALTRTICGVDAVAITVDGAPRPQRDIVVWNPPVLDAASGTRASATAEVAGLVTDLVTAGHRTLVFTTSRRSAEAVAEQAKHRLDPELAARVACYRGGHLVEERLEVEAGLASGDLLAVAATSALELGVDIGGIDAVVLHGFPSTASSFWQQVGRAGRRDRPSVAVLVCGSDQLDQWIAAHPAALLDAGVEPVVVRPDNPHVVDAELRCAAFELSFTHDDEALWPGVLDDAVRRLVADNSVLVRPAGAGTVGRPGRHRRMVADSPVGVWHGGGWPVDRVALRSTSPGSVKIVDEAGKPVGSIDVASAPQVVHPGAVYLHSGRRWRVATLDLESRRAVVAPHDEPTRTAPRVRTTLRLGTAEMTRAHDGYLAGWGPATVTTAVTSYVERSRDGEVLSTDRLDLPRRTVDTEACWLSFGDAVPPGWSPRRRRAAIHAVEHALVGVAPLLAWCDRADLAGTSTSRHRDTGQPTAIIYDRHAGGIGIAEQLATQAPDLVEAAFRLLDSCGCANGCPSCLHQPHCPSGNRPLRRDDAVLVLAAAARQSTEISGRSISRASRLM